MKQKSAAPEFDQKAWDANYRIKRAEARGHAELARTFLYITPTWIFVAAYLSIASFSVKEPLMNLLFWLSCSLGLTSVFLNRYHSRKLSQKTWESLNPGKDYYNQ